MYLDPKGCTNIKNDFDESLGIWSNVLTRLIASNLHFGQIVGSNFEKSVIFNRINIKMSCIETLKIAKILKMILIRR